MLALFALLYALSGFAFLSAEMILIREMGLRTGSTPLSAAWVLSVFFLFAAVGAKLGGRCATNPTVSARRYGWAELAIGVSLALIYLLREPVFNDVFLGRPWEYAYALFLAGIPSLLSGMTLPLLGAAVVGNKQPESRNRRAAFLYGANLLGASLGIPVGGVYLPWHFGFAATVWAIVGLLVVVALVAVLSSRWLSNEETAPIQKNEAQATASQLPTAWVAGVMIASGVLTLATEILAIGYFQIIAEESIYSYSAVFLIFILGLALGAIVAAIWRPSLVLILMATAVLLMITPLILQLVFFERDRLPSGSEMTYYARLITVAGCALLPLLAMQGAVFPLAWAWLRRQQSMGPALGHFLFLNKLGSAAGVLIAGYCLLRYFGYVGSFLLLGSLYGILALAGVYYASARRGRSLAAFGSVLVMALALGWGLGKAPIGLEDGEHLLATYYGKSDLVTVVVDEHESRHIRINQAYTLNGTQRALGLQKMEGWLPCVLNPDPKRVLFIGMASGISARSVLDFPVEELTAVELSPEVLRAAKEHFSEWNTVLFEDERALIVVDDGRHVLTQTEGWDLVICDLFNPVRAGTSQMYSRDFFELAAAHLSPTGQMVVWLPAYQFDSPMMASVMQGFAEAFDHAIVLRANFDPIQPVIGLVGSHEPIDLSTDYLAGRLEAVPGVVRKQSPIFLRSVANFRLAYVGDLHESPLSPYWAEYPVNTDDFPYIAYLGPRQFEQGELLRGTNLLNWGASMFQAVDMPSSNLSSLSLDTIQAAQRAANHYYAAVAMGISLPDATQEKRMDRQRRYINHMRTAFEGWPTAEVTPIDLVH